jgi:predicted neuraminidase
MLTQNPSREIKSLVYKGFPPDHCCCDAIWRRLPGGEQGVFFLTGGPAEPHPENYVALCRSHEEGTIWNAPEPVIHSPDGAVTLSEVVVQDGAITIYLQRHDGGFGNWEVLTITSTDNGRTWSTPELFAPLPHRAMIRNLYRTSWGEWLLPIQFYEARDDWRSSPQEDGSFSTPWNGVLIAATSDGPWTRSRCIQGAKNWAENNVVELSDGRLIMLVRSDGDGFLMRSESRDRGRSWSTLTPTALENPGSKFRLFRLRDGRILLLHNPTPQTKHPNSKPCCHVNRNPLALWISNDDMESWSYRRVITDFPGMLAYPDGEVDETEAFLHFAFDYNRHDVIYWKIELPEVGA